MIRSVRNPSSVEAILPGWSFTHAKAARSNCSRLHAAFDHSGCDGMPGEAGGVVDVELFHEALAVFLNCFDADVQFISRLLVGFAFSDKLEDFHLARGQSHGLGFSSGPAEGQSFLFLI